MPLFKPTEQFDLKNRSQWLKWKNTFLRFYHATKFNQEEEQLQVDSLIYLMGPQVENIFNQFNLSEENQGKFGAKGAALDAYFQPRSNVIFDGTRLFQRTEARRNC